MREAPSPRGTAQASKSRRRRAANGGCGRRLSVSYRATWCSRNRSVAGRHRREVLVQHRGFWRRAPESRPNLLDRRLQLALADPGMDVRLSTHYHAYRTVPLPAELRVTLEKSPSKVRAPKISKTTPRKVAGGRHGCFESKLTRRANQRHFFTIPQSCKRPSLRNNGRVGCDCGRKILTHH
jgi:hypothetical protein